MENYLEFTFNGTNSKDFKTEQHIATFNFELYRSFLRKTIDKLNNIKNRFGICNNQRVGC